jgi:hypothetical protein
MTPTHDQKQTHGAEWYRFGQRFDVACSVAVPNAVQ